MVEFALYWVKIIRDVFSISVEGWPVETQLPAAGHAVPMIHRRLAISVLTCHADWRRLLSPHVARLTLACRGKLFDVFPSPFQRREGPYRRGHQPAIAFVNQTIDVLNADMGVTANDAIGVASLKDDIHRPDDNRMVILPGIPEILRKVAFAGDDQPHSRNFLENTRKVFHRLNALTHHADVNFPFRIDRPHIGARVIFRLGQPPIARGDAWTVAALAVR